jgi:hypothetical protein
VDRSHFLLFEPCPLELHRNAATWFWDPETSISSSNLHFMAQHSLRTYVLAWEFKQAGMDWRQSVLARCLTGTRFMVAKLKANTSLTTEEDRVREFVNSGAGCRATYFNHAKALQPLQATPGIRLVHSAPPTESNPISDQLKTLDAGSSNSETTSL